jgi:peptidoglycan/xylan/chitin deacetylase (PgdA/CDA1 family)
MGGWVVTEPSRPVIGRRALLAGAGGLLAAACSGRRRATAPVRASTAPPVDMSGPSATRPAPTHVTTRPVSAPVPAPPAVILARSTVPVLCFHQVRDWATGDSASAKVIITPPGRLAAQLDALAAAGYTTITPDQLLAHLRYGARLPSRPVLLSFDDASGGQYTHALPLLLRHRFTATFFVMTVVLDKPRWLSRAQVRDLHRHGMTIAAHTWDHHPVTRYTGADWQRQLVDPARDLARLIGAPVRLFAYPYGLWDQAALPHVHAAGYEAAFQLSQRQDPRQPLLTIRRMIAASEWDGGTLIQQMRAQF